MTDMTDRSPQFQAAKALLDSLRAQASARANPALLSDASDTSASSTESIAQKSIQTRLQANSLDTSPYPQQLSARALVALWSRFSHIYGHRWENAYGSALNENDELTPVALTWARTLGCYGPDDLAHGLRLCVERADGWPPTLPEFRALCHIEPARRLLPALPKPELTERDREAGRLAIAKMRKLLGMPPSEVLEKH